MTTATTALIAEQNDPFRGYGPLAGLQGQMFTTAGIAALPDYLQATVLIKMQAFASFTEDNDPQKVIFGAEVYMPQSYKILLWPVKSFKRTCMNS